MELEFLVPPLVVALGGALLYWNHVRFRDRSRASLDEKLAEDVVDSDSTTPEVRTFPRRYPWAAPLAAAVVAIALATLPFARVPVAFVVAISFLVGVLTAVGEFYWAGRRVGQIESQLAEAVDMMVGALRVGASLTASIENTLGAVGDPLRTYLREVVGRVRLGDDPAEAVMDLSRRVPLEVFRFFSLSLAVHWETGGGLASTLASIGHAIRDRIDLGRRVRAQSVEVQVSVIGVFIITYFLAFLMWRSNPGPVEEFLGSAVGSAIAGGAMMLQGVGVFWIWRLSRVET